MTESQRLAIAEALALQVLAYLGETDNLLEVFLSASGLTPGDLRASLHETDLHAAVLDFLMMDDAWVMGFSAATGFPPERVMTTRQSLPGSDLPNWT